MNDGTDNRLRHGSFVPAGSRVKEAAGLHCYHYVVGSAGVCCHCKQQDDVKVK